MAQGTPPPLPSTSPLGAGMVDTPSATGGPNTVAIRTITQVRNIIWAGGVFDEIDDANGDKVADANGLAPFEAATGALPAGVHVPLFSSSTSTPPEVYGSSLGANGILYLVGRFDGVDGQARHNVAAIDPQTGAVLPFGPDAGGTAWSILATPDAIFVGTGRLLSFQLDGEPSVGYDAPAASIDSSLRPNHENHPAFRDIEKLGDTLVSPCVCDSLTDANGTRTVKAVVEISATTGDWVNWASAGVSPSSAAFGIDAIIHDDPRTNSPVIYLATGGSDFMTALPFTPDANGQATPLWHTDTSGSSQALGWYQGSLIVGGHFNWTASPTTRQCGSNTVPDTSCYYTPKLVAMNPAHGQLLLDPSTNEPWNPGICCRYNGIWTVAVGLNGSSLNVGGEFDRSGGTWTCDTFEDSCLSGSTLHRNYARFGGSSAVKETLTVSTAGSGFGTVTDPSLAIDCGLSCSTDFPAGTYVTLTATPRASSKFTGWSSADPGISCPGTGPCTIAMSRVREVTATFVDVSTATVDDGDRSIAYNGWRGVLASAASGGSYRVSTTQSDSATWKSPTTTSFTWTAHAGPNQGIASVVIDGTKQPPVNLYSQARGSFSKTYSGLTKQAHTVVVKVTGTKDASSGGTGVSVDAFKAAGTTYEDPSYTIQYDDWNGNARSEAHGGAYRIAGTGDSIAEVTFTGTSIDWITALGKTYGEASVTIDGVPQGTFDLYAATQSWQQTLKFGGLTSGSHTLTIEVLGQKNPSSTGTNVVTDGFTIHL